MGITRCQGFSAKRHLFSTSLPAGEQGCGCGPLQHPLICAGEGEASPRCLWQVDVHRAVVSYREPLHRLWVLCTTAASLWGVYNWRFKQLNCFLNAFVVAKIQSLQFCRSSTWNIALWQMGLSPPTAQERGSWQGASLVLVRNCSVPTWGAGFGPVEGITGGFYWLLATVCGWRRSLKRECGES